MSIYGDEDVVSDDEAIDSPAQDTFQETDKQRRRREYFGTKAGKAWLKNYRQQTGASNAQVENKFNVDLNNDGDVGDGQQAEEQEGTIGDAEIMMDETVPRVQERQPQTEFSIFGTGEFQPNTDALDLIGMKPSMAKEPSIVFAAKGFKKRVREPTIIFAGESGAEDVMIKPVRSRASGKKSKASKSPSIKDIMGFGSMKGSMKGRGKRFRFL